MKRSRVALLITVFVLAGLIPSFEKSPPVLSGARDAYWEMLYRSAPRREAPANIFVAGLTQEDLVAHGHWPWPRSRMVDVTENLAARGPKVLTMGFTSANLSLNYLRLLMEGSAKYPLLKLEESGLESYSDHIFWDVDSKIKEWLDLRGRQVGETSPLLGGEFASQRQEFLKAIRAKSRSEDNSRYVEVLCGFPGVCLQTIGVEGDKAVLKEHFPLMDQYISLPSHPVDEEGERPRGAVEEIPELEQVVPFFQEARPCAGIEGIFEPLPESSSVRWRRKLLFRFRERVYPSVELAAAALYLDARPRIRWNKRGFELYLGGRAVPVDGSGAAWIDYSPDVASYPRAGLSEVLAGRLPGLEGKSVFLLQTTALAPHFPPMQRTPRGEYVSQGQLIVLGYDSLLNGHCFKTVPRSMNMFAPGLLLLALILWFRKSALALSICGAASLAVFLLAGWACFRANMLLDPLPFAAWALTGPGIAASFAYYDHLREKKAVLNAFRHYLSPQVLKEVIAHPELLVPGGRRKEITVLFCDIRGFTTLSEKRPPGEVTRLLNIYLEAMTRCIFRQEGTIDKFIGDAIMAYFGAPLEQADHSGRALESALGMLDALEAVRAEWRALGADTLEIGIGIHTGEAIVGNLGSKDRFDYTVIGDTVNTAQRIEDATKSAGVSLLVSAEIKARAEGKYYFEKIGEFRLKGKAESVPLFSVRR